MPAVAGAILAGGRSRRFGADKLRLRLPGESRDLATRAADTLSACALSPRWWLAPEAPGALPPGFAFLADPGEGPKAALACALEALVGARADAVLLLAADLPLIQEAHLRRLLQAWADHPRDHPLCLADAEGRAQPVCAVYPLACLPLLTQQLAEGDRALFSLVEQARKAVSTPSEVTVSVTEPQRGRDTIHPCFNLNQDQDWEQLLDWSKEGKLP